MTVRLLTFARPRELLGPAVELEVPDGGTVAHLRAALAAHCPELGPLLPACRFAVNQKYAAEADPIAAGDEVALVAPVSGG